jgi:anti-sigma regulatory factor (Ser/Thr protein kinase)
MSIPQPSTGPAGDQSTVLWTGRCMAWQLPPDETCAAMARTQVREVLRALLMPAELVCDATTVVSELATNVFAHALGGRASAAVPVAALPELYLYRRGIQPEIVVKVFDSAPWQGAFPPRPPRPGPAAESGRGLHIVNGLVREHGGHWGVHRTRSRLAPTPVPGKAAYFTLPIPPACPALSPDPPRPDCAQAARELEKALAARGLNRMRRCEAANIAVLSVRAEITVWARQNAFWVTMPTTGTLRHPLSDITEVTEAIVHCNEDLNAR